MLKLVIAILGIFAGAALGFIAGEEVKAGKKYLELDRYAISALLIVVSVFFLFNSQQEMLAVVLLVLGGLSFFLSWQWSWKITEVLFYFLFVSTYFLLPAQNTVIASILFVYGLFVGSLLWLDYETYQKRSRRNT